eukprot:3936853-Prymnesium_polylepis.1
MQCQARKILALTDLLTCTRGQRWCSDHRWLRGRRGVMEYTGCVVEGSSARRETECEHERNRQPLQKTDLDLVSDAA